MSLYNVPTPVSHQDSANLVDVIFTNFEYLSNNTELKHNKTELYRLVTSPSAKIYFILDDTKRVMAYLVGEIMTLNDGRLVFYVSYLYTASMYRNKGVASMLMAYVDVYAKKMLYDGVMLTTDTSNVSLMHFYESRGFVRDVLLRRYARYDVMYKVV